MELPLIILKKQEKNLSQNEFKRNPTNRHCRGISCR
ncbi:hypothetical protein MHK_009391 [Candidatus Magnetomorum sp. HK-1]|nr:hypothetical protein MHK_009391 [Candidatus Magnetomorum sp. HK-1]